MEAILISLFGGAKNFGGGHQLFPWCQVDDLKASLV
jgi:hypothetical protein